MLDKLRIKLTMRLLRWTVPGRIFDVAGNFFVDFRSIHAKFLGILPKSTKTAPVIPKSAQSRRAKSAAPLQPVFFPENAPNPGLMQRAMSPDSASSQAAQP